MNLEVLIAGGGLGGLAAAVAASRAGWETRLLEQAGSLSEAGAGIQLGPNATRILREWGLLQGDLAARLAFPERLVVRDALDGGELAHLALGRAVEARYGAPYAAVHRADLQAALLGAATAAGTRLHTGTRVLGATQQEGVVRAATAGGRHVEADALVAADGLWSQLRGAVAGESAPLATGHLAYRGLVAQADLPRRMRSAEVTVWLAPRMHLVAYPVRGGELLNVVCVVHGRVEGDPRHWDHAAVAADLQAALGPLAAPLPELVQAVARWRLWVLHDRPPLRGPQEMAAGCIALLGDAAHPMRPYLAQGAGMALEDARELQRVLCVVDGRTLDVPTALQRYALNRWQRCARVQARSQRNGRIFHADGVVRWGRNLSLRMLGARLLEQPWLYGYGG